MRMAYLMRYMKVWLMVALFAVVGVGVIHAADDNGIPIFTDGRVNNWQMDEPVAVYCHFAFTNPNDTNAGVLQDIEVWGLTGNKLLTTTGAQIDAATSKLAATSSKAVTANSITLDSEEGYALTLMLSLIH